MMRKVIIFLVVALLSGSVFAGDFSKSGTVGAQFLKVGVGARYHGIGEAGVACANDIYAMYWNPAGLAMIAENELAFTHVDYVLDVNMNYIAYARRVEGIGVLGIAATMLSMGSQEITTVEEPDGTGYNYEASSWAFQINYARDLTARFSFGAAFKVIGEKIYREKSQGYAFDFGTLLNTGFNSLRMGMSISNMGPEMKFDGPDLDVSYDPDPSNPNQDPFNGRLKVDEYDLPLTFRVGVAYDLEFDDNSKVVLNAEIKHPNDNVQQGSLGAEYSWMDKYFLRAGYKLNSDEESYSFGGGFDTPLTETTDLVLDYAWVDYGRFSSVHRFSASLKF